MGKFKKMVSTWIKFLSKGFFFLTVIYFLFHLRDKYHIHIVEDLQLFSQHFTDPLALSMVSFLQMT